MNVKGAGATQAEVARDTVDKVQAAGFPVSVEQMDRLAGQIGENTLFGRTGGAATLAVGMAQIFSKAVAGRWLDLWYHFAIMFEALFILTTLDAGTRVGRYLLHDVLGNVWKPLGDTRDIRANLVVSTGMVAAWGYFLIQGVRDPLGGINSLWPLFGIANQMLAAVALCLATTIILKMQLAPASPSVGARKAFMFVTLIPLVWLLAVTLTAGVQKIFHPKPAIGFLAKARVLDQALPELERKVQAAEASGTAAALEAATKALRANRMDRFNQVLDAVVAGVFLVLVVLIVFLSVREWILLLAGKRPAVLHETAPVWLPGYALAESRPVHLFGILALAFGLMKELFGEAQQERMHQAGARRVCLEAQGARQTDECCGKGSERDLRARVYLAVTDHRFKGVNRCC
jgi:carbon starvation protein